MDDIVEIYLSDYDYPPIKDIYPNAKEIISWKRFSNFVFDVNALKKRWSENKWYIENERIVEVTGKFKTSPIGKKQYEVVMERKEVEYVIKDTLVNFLNKTDKTGYYLMLLNGKFVAFIDEGY